MTATLDAQAPPGFPDDDAQVFGAGDRRLFDTVHGLEETVVRANARAERAEAEAGAQFRVNLELQRHLDEYNTDRRAYETTIADLRAENGLLRAALAATDATPRRGRWRR